jgi:RNA polymerase sigma factor (sigma-70 family)
MAAVSSASDALEPTDASDDADASEPVATFEDLYRREYDGLVRVAYLLVGDEALAEEVVQDAFVTTHLRWAKLSRPGGFLRTCVVNGCRDRLRRRGRLATITPLLAADRATSDHDAAAADELFDVLATLPLRQRAAIVGRFYCGWDDSALAEALGVRPATVRSLVHRGLAALRIELTS